MTHLSRPLLLIALCFVVVAAGCSGGVSVSGTTQSFQTNPSARNSVEGNWAMISPASITLEIFQNGSSLTVLLNGSPCSGIMSPITLQGSVTEDSVTLSGSGITISATVSFGAPQTLSGTITCGVSTISFTATNIASVTGQWTGTFTALGPTNNGVQTSVDANLVETLNSNNFPTLTGSVSFGKLGSMESCLAAAAGGGLITRGAILGTGVFIQAISKVNGQTVTIIGTADPTGNFINVASYSVGCGTSAFAGTEVGTGSLSRN